DPGGDDRDQRSVATASAHAAQASAARGRRATRTGHSDAASHSNPSPAGGRWAHIAGVSGARMARRVAIAGRAAVVIVMIPQDHGN
ncbi:MAG TPA: hypothetical protein VIX73_21520, partial [Kofleriaceae bacterium]